MLVQNYFANRLGDVYKYSRITYQSGKGISNRNKEYFWNYALIMLAILFLCYVPKKQVIL